jgi:hypothetical protein
MHPGPVGVQCGQRGDLHLLAGSPRVSDQPDWGVTGPVLGEDVAGPAELPRPASRARVVQGEDQVCSGHRAQPDLHRFPGGEQIGKGQAGEVASQRGAQQRSGRDSRCDTGYHPNRGASCGWQRGGGGQRQRGHPVDAGVTGGDQRHPGALGGRADRILGALLLGADLAGYEVLVWGSEIGAGRQVTLVSEHHLGVPNGVLSGAGPVRSTAGPQPDDAERAGHGDLRLPVGMARPVVVPGSERRRQPCE